MKGEKAYEYDLDVKGVTDYGVSLDATSTHTCSEVLASVLKGNKMRPN